ncbi:MULTISPECIES: RNA-binding protein [unclassified Mesorhizobium]|uniref:RNA-binding protein n=1 Tax=unclassified Mesorhizobium TaxID=325217 RepID=UPI0016782AFE|nr:MULTISPECIES: RNA-binding protein [unclassified Mesorhizobium]
MAFTKHSGIFGPGELELLQKVFDQLCNERRLALKDGDQRKQLACDVIQAFQSGFTAEVELWQSLSKRRAARVRSDLA